MHLSIRTTIRRVYEVKLKQGSAAHKSLADQILKYASGLSACNFLKKKKSSLKMKPTYNLLKGKGLKDKFAKDSYPFFKLPLK